MAAMAGTCISCLSTHNLIDMREKEWTVIDMLLHPISKQYSCLRTNQLLKICINCQRSMHYVDQFRTSILKNFSIFTSMWNMGKSSTNANDGTFNVEQVDIKPQPLWYTIAPTLVADEYKLMPPMSTSSAAADPHTITSKEVQSIKQEVEPSVIFSTSIVKTEPNDEIEDTNIGDEIIDKKEVPVFYSGHEACNVTETPKEHNTIHVYSKESETQHKIKDEKNATLSAMLQMPAKEQPNLSKEQLNPTKEQLNPCKESSNSPKETLNKTYSCKKCDKTYTLLKELTFHEKRVHISAPVDCSKCGKTWKNEYCLRRHMTNVHSEKTYCDVCNKYFAPTSYKKHLKTSPKHNNPDALKASRVSCEICNSTLRDKHELKQHLRVHTDLKYCEPCDKWFPPKSYKNHLTQSLKHISKDDYKFICAHCNEKFLTKNILRDHILFVHLNINPFKCPLCPMEFKNHTSRSRHRRIVHENKHSEKKHICDVCGKAWHTSALLQDHKSVHTGARPYKCGKCDARYGQKSALYLHNRIKHEKKFPPKLRKTCTSTLIEK